MATKTKAEDPEAYARELARLRLKAIDKMTSDPTAYLEALAARTKPSHPWRTTGKMAYPRRKSLQRGAQEG